MNSYLLQQIDSDGSVVAEQHVDATSAEVALRQLNDIDQTTQIINVRNAEDERVGQVDADYWRQKYRRSRR